MAYIGSMTEERQQEALVTYIQLQYPAVRYCASLGGQYQQYQSQRSKARKGFHGLFIELKTKTGRLTKYQQNWIDDLNERGYKAECCYGLEKALDLIDWYLNEKG